MQLPGVTVSGGTMRAVVHGDLTQNVVMVTEDKLKLCLSEHLAAQRDRAAWQGPLGMFLSLLLTAVTADFKETMGVKAAVWSGVFGFFLAFSIGWGIWSIVVLARSWLRGDPIACVIRDLKKGVEPTTGTTPALPAPATARPAGQK